MRNSKAADGKKMIFMNSGKASSSGGGNEYLGAPSEHLKLEELDSDMLLARKRNLIRPLGRQRIFGGQIVGQAIQAANSSVGDIRLHSMHSYFMRGGNANEDILYCVERLRDGHAFSTRFVSAKQSGEVIFVLIASYQKVKHLGFDWYKPMPQVPDPETLPTEKDRLISALNDPRCPEAYKPFLEKEIAKTGAIDLRRVSNVGIIDSLKALMRDDKVPDSSRHAVWMRIREKLPDDPNSHRAAAAFASDIVLLATALINVNLRTLRQVMSLDHSMWFHSDFRADEWLLYVLESPRGYSERAITFCMVYQQNGSLAMSISQEGLIRTDADAKL